MIRWCEKYYWITFPNAKALIGKQISHLQEQGRPVNKGDPEEIAIAIMALGIGLKVLLNFMDRIRTGFGRSGKIRFTIECPIHLRASNNGLENMTR
jgi:hypothetical protein